MDLPIALDDRSTLLVAIGLGAVVGVLFGGWVMTALHKLLMGLVKLALLGVVVLIGIFLWSEYQGSRPSEYSPSIPPYGPSAAAPRLIEPASHETVPAKRSGRWWEE